jgi:hypothetical protein
LSRIDVVPDKTLNVAAAELAMPGQTKLKAAGQPLLPPKDSHHVSTLRQWVGGMHQAPAVCRQLVENATGMSTTQMQVATASARLQIVVLDIARSCSAVGRRDSDLAAHVMQEMSNDRWNHEVTDKQ